MFFSVDDDDKDDLQIDIKVVCDKGGTISEWKENIKYPYSSISKSIEIHKITAPSAKCTVNIDVFDGKDKMPTDNSKSFTVIKSP